MGKKRFGRILLSTVLLILLLMLGYLVYVFASYHRMEDNLDLAVEQRATNSVKVDNTYKIVTYNVGFGAYSRDYTFFMDGGKYSRAYDKNTVNANTKGAGLVVQQVDPDFIFFQEVDLDSTRSYHVNQYHSLKKLFREFSTTFAINYDSSYLLYPFQEPHGKSLAGIATFSKARIVSAMRFQLPIEKGMRKFLDLDRCYSVSRVAVENGKDLCLYNVHLSAYTKDDTISNAQLDLLFKDMATQYQAGNYVIAGGDFNKDLLGDSSSYFAPESESRQNKPSWAQPFPLDRLPANFSIQVETDPITPSCRNADIPYEKGVSFVTVLDGFLCSDNVKVEQVKVLDTEFSYSYHNPVMMKFVLLSADQ